MNEEIDKKIAKRDNLLIVSGLGLATIGMLLSYFNEWFRLIEAPGILIMIYFSYLKYIERKMDINHERTQ